MKTVPHFFIACIVFSSASAFAGCRSDVPSGGAEDLSVVSPTFEVSNDEGQRTVTTLGTLKNASSDCLESVVIEIKYFDAKNALIDTVTQPIYGVVVPPKQEVAFRVRDSAARPKDAYSSQTLRVVSADSRGSRNAKPQSNSPFVEFLVSWGPMLLLVGVWIFFMQRMKRKDSPQGRTLALFEQQNAILVAQNNLLARIAAATEGKAVQRDGA